MRREAVLRLKTTKVSQPVDIRRALDARGMAPLALNARLPVLARLAIVMKLLALPALRDGMVRSRRWKRAGAQQGAARQRQPLAVAGAHLRGSFWLKSCGQPGAL